MTTIYIVTRGSYSDYSIEAVFTTRALAEHYAKLHPVSDIEEHTVDKCSLEHVRKDAKGRAEVRVLSDSARKDPLNIPYVKMDGIVRHLDVANSHVVLPHVDNVTEEMLERGAFDFVCIVESFEGRLHAQKLCVERLQRWRAIKAGVA